MDSEEFTEFESYLQEQIAPQGFIALVRGALAMLEEAESLLSRAPWVTSNWLGAKNATQQWVACPCEKHAKLVFEEAKNKEDRADTASNASKDVGDWWTYEAVNEAYTLCEAVALHSGLPEANPDDPLEIDPSNAVLWVCSYFACYPSNVKRTFERAKAVVEGNQ